ncbi:hypothetical protein MUN84_00470 [Hymenobacter sp. 5516J-16]|uniref:hypothetical protein n=1 Tax=Hymenobacter sp. 5516J-16 TaxID=2932253 RepID=UPI001FD1C499|nr:hypothetical protein [Hymenobacter sp. 5516J-16]UOQ77250.1 hypothetical protein MUN84_00470 [Hymenobacter sp. 5516J-16]
MQAGDVDVTYADIRKAQHLLGYAPKLPWPRDYGSLCAGWTKLNTNINQLPVEKN